MARKIAVASALIVFAVCLVQGLQADNGFSTTVSRALAAMFGTLAVGLVVGAMAQRMVDESRASGKKPAAGTAGAENLKVENSKKGRTKTQGDDR